MAFSLYLNALGVHMREPLRVGPQHPGVAFLRHQKVREVHLFELETDWCLEEGGHVVSRPFAQSHGLRHFRNAEFDHHRVRVAVDHFGRVFVPVFSGVFRLDFLYVKILDFFSFFLFLKKFEIFIHFW